MSTLKTLIVCASRPEREGQAKVLAAARHIVSEAQDCKSALQALEAGPDVVLLDLALPNGGAVELMKRINARTSVASPHVILTCDQNPGADFDLLYASGARDFLRKPFWREELLARVGAPLRAGKGTARGLVFRVPDEPEALAWPDAEPRLAEALAELTSAALAPLGNRGSACSMGMAAKISLVDSANQREVRLTVSAGHPTLFSLANTMLGESKPTKALVEDLLREIANTCAGVLKRTAASPDTLTLGLPEMVPIGDPTSGSSTARTMTLGSIQPALELSLALEQISRAKRRVQAHGLCEGWVISCDLRNDAGLLLLPAGTRLTSSAIERVVRVVGRDHLVEVSS